jgi:hypothetical protein
MGTASPAGPTGAGSVVPAHLPWSMPASSHSQVPSHSPSGGRRGVSRIPKYSKYSLVKRKKTKEKKRKKRTEPPVSQRTAEWQRRHRPASLMALNAPPENGTEPTCTTCHRHFECTLRKDRHGKDGGRYLTCTNCREAVARRGARLLLMPNDAATLNFFGCSSTHGEEPMPTTAHDAASSNAFGCSTLKSNDDENAFSNGVEMPKRKQTKCEHGRRKDRCVDCGGDAFCIHRRRKDACRQCGGKNICKHRRIKFQCKQCAGRGTCIHKRRKRDCRDCGGTGVCVHGKSKYRCKECDGSGICSHGRVKSICKECGGSGICSHGKRKGDCSVCQRAAAVSSNKAAAELEGLMV